MKAWKGAVWVEAAAVAGAVDAAVAAVMTALRGVVWIAVAAVVAAVGAGAVDVAAIASPGSPMAGAVDQGSFVIAASYVVAAAADCAVAAPVSLVLVEPVEAAETCQKYFVEAV
mmetsp:Transcript_90471/g.161159  ORF Transcript_90471/g.161159 Transcript_90471/m.161159 type:complete len:114 (+) Transcript_90471:66-407(+)